MRFIVEFSPRARDHLKSLRKRDQQVFLDVIASQLTLQADKPTRHRKQLEENELAPWELRVGNYRVFYDVDRDQRVVIVVAVGEKSHNILRLGGEEIEL